MDNEFYLYDQVLLGQKRTCGKEIFETTINGKKEYNPADEEVAIKIVRYFVEYYMGWSPEEAMLNIDQDILYQFHLDSLVTQRIRFPAELEPMENLQYLVHRLYPIRFPYHKRQAVELYYSRILSGKIRRFKKFFFSQEDGCGEERAGICFRMMLQQIGYFSSYKELYDLFMGAEGRRILINYKLSSACRDLFEFPLDFLHYSLPERCRQEAYYHRLRFQLINDKQKKNLRKSGEFIA